jgi:uncharacterized protein (TIGR03086 family)
MDIKDLWARAVDGFGERVRGVADDQWDKPTPCTDWNVRNLVNHVAGELLWAAELGGGRTMAEVGDRFEGDVLGGDPKATVEQGAEAAINTFRGDHAEQIDTTQGKLPFQQYLGQMFVDALVHSWDLAVATGQNTTLDPGLCAIAYQQSAAVREMIDGARQAGIFGAEVQVPEDATDQDKLLGLLGRDPAAG